MVSKNIWSDTLNSKTIVSYLQTNSTSIGDTYMVINSTSILGNLEMAIGFRSFLYKLTSEAVSRNSAEIIKFRRRKKFHRIKAMKLSTQNLNSIDKIDFMFATDFFKNITISGKKNLKFLKVHKAVNIVDVLDIDFINNRSLADAGLSYQKKFKYVTLDKPLISKDIVVDLLNGKHFSNILDFVDQNLNLHTKLIFTGDATFKNSLKVENINKFNWNWFREKIVDKTIYKKQIIRGHKIFKNIVEMEKVNNLQIINNINLKDLFHNILLKDRSQIITGYWSFGKVNFRDTIMNHINYIEMGNLIDRRKSVKIISDLYVEICDVSKYVNGVFLYDFENLFNKIKNVNQHKFNEVTILDHAQWPTKFGNETSIDYLNKYGVRKDAEQVITGKVVLMKPLINSAFTKNKIFKDFDFEYIAKDCLYKSSIEPQYITAETVFTRPIQMDSVKTVNTLKTKFINNIDMNKFNSSTFRIHGESTVIQGKKQFKKFIFIKDLVLQHSKIDGIDVNNLYCYLNKTPVPSISIGNVKVYNSLEKLSVNNNEFESFLSKRIVKRGRNQELLGQPTFLQLNVAKNINLKSINNINIDDIIIISSKNLQNLKGNKKIYGSLFIMGPSTVHNLNNKSLIEKTKSSVILKNNYKFQVIFMFL